MQLKIKVWLWIEWVRYKCVRGIRFLLYSFKRWNCVCSFRQENMQIKISIVSTWSYLTFRIVDWITNYVIQFKSRITINIKKCVSVNRVLKIRIKRASKQLYFALKLYKFDYDCWVQAILVYWMFTKFDITYYFKNHVINWHVYYFIYILSTGTMNTSCVDAKLHSLGWKFEDLTYNYTSNNLSDCSYKNMIKTPSDEYFRCEQWNKASGFLNSNVKATA